MLTEAAVEHEPPDGINFGAVQMLEYELQLFEIKGGEEVGQTGSTAFIYKMMFRFCSMLRLVTPSLLKASTPSCGAFEEAKEMSPPRKVRAMTKVRFAQPSEPSHSLRFGSIDSDDDRLTRGTGIGGFAQMHRSVDHLKIFLSRHFPYVLYSPTEMRQAASKGN